MAPEYKYARIQRERRFLLGQFPTNLDTVRLRRITDPYIEGTSLRLRKQSDDGVSTIFKLTQKVPMQASGGQQGLITSMYLTEDEFGVHPDGMIGFRIDPFSPWHFSESILPAQE